MKIAITSYGDSPSSELDARFGRARYFIIYDTETGEFRAVDNEINLNAPQGAGIQAAQVIAGEGAEVLITGHCGPNAFKVLGAAGIKVFVGASGTVEHALRLYNKGKLHEAPGPDVQGHWM